MKTRDIAVVGAGIGGLAFAALAARSGARVRVFDQFKAPAPVGSGLVIQPVGQAVLSHLGAEEAMTLGQRITRMRGDEADHGRRVLDVAYDPSGQDCFGLAIHRASLFHVLYQAALASGAEVVPAAEVRGRDGQRLVIGAGQRAGPFDLIVDAAGAKSPLSPLRGRALPYGAIWGNVPWPTGTRLPQDQLSQRYRAARQMAGVLPIGRLPGGTTPMAAVFWSLGRSGHAAWRGGSIAHWKAEVGRLWPAMDPFLSEISSHGDMTFAQYSHGSLIRPVTDGMAHIGDAAHRASPQLGQGANMALLDAMALSIALAHHHHLPDALAGYAKGRRWHVALYQTLSALFTPQYQSDGTLAPMLRDRILAPLSRVPPLPRRLSRLVCGDLIPPYGSLPMLHAHPRHPQI